MPVARLDRRFAGAVEPSAKTVVFYDDRLTGFGLRVTPNGVRTWIVEYRPGAGGRRVAKRRLSLGRDSEVFRADAARARAKEVLAEVRLGADPMRRTAEARQSANVRDVIEAYLDEKIRPKRKASTVTLFDGYARNHLVPAIGARSATELTRAEVTKAHAAIGKLHRVTANRCVAVLHAAFEHARLQGRVPSGMVNPAASVDRFPEARRERFLTAEELSRLGASLRLAETEGLPWSPRDGCRVKHAPKPANRRVKVDPHAIAAIRMLLLTGARLREVLKLEWSQVDAERGLLLLPDSKTGRKTIVLGGPAIALLGALPRHGPYVFPGEIKLDPSGHPFWRPRSDLNRPWARIRRHAGLEGLRLHDLRHSFASVGAGAGLGLPIIGKLLGHTSAATTARYAHLDADPLRRASDQIGTRLVSALQGETLQ